LEVATFELFQFFSTFQQVQPFKVLNLFYPWRIQDTKNERKKGRREGRKEGSKQASM
jgi:hypothetical protein